MEISNNRKKVIVSVGIRTAWHLPIKNILMNFFFPNKYFTIKIKSIIPYSSSTFRLTLISSIICIYSNCYNNIIVFKSVERRSYFFLIQSDVGKRTTSIIQCFVGIQLANTEVRIVLFIGVDKMTNLKEELNQYLARNDTSKNGTSMTAGLKTLGKLFKKPDSEDNEDLLTSNQKYFCHDFCPALVDTLKLYCTSVSMTWSKKTSSYF